MKKAFGAWGLEAGGFSRESAEDAALFITRQGSPGQQVFCCKGHGDHAHYRLPRWWCGSPSAHRTRIRKMLCRWKDVVTNTLVSRDQGTLRPGSVNRIAQKKTPVFPSRELARVLNGGWGWHSVFFFFSFFFFSSSFFLSLSPALLPCPARPLPNRMRGMPMQCVFRP
jgi:hypothetical protein